MTIRHAPAGGHVGRGGTGGLPPHRRGAPGRGPGKVLWEGFIIGVVPRDLLLGLVKSLAFGLTIGWIC